MRVLIVYDSFFGNTERIAQAIGSALGGAPEVEVQRVTEVAPEQLNGLDWLIVGSPTRAFRPSENTQKLLASVPAGSLAGVKAAAFDTRIPESKMPGFLRFIVKRTGYADQKIASALARKGAQLVAQPGQFYVLASEGPLQDGELERAFEWARGLKIQR
jgi:flavodoxin